MQIDGIIFVFYSRAGRAEIPSLADNRLRRPAYGSRPPKGELLRSLELGLIETKLNTMERDRFIKDDSDLLFTFFRSAPTGGSTL